MFEVSQLYMDLTTARLMSSPDIKTNAQIKLLIAEVIEFYFKNMETKNEDGEDAFVFGYLSQKKSSNQKSTLTPTDLDFMVSPCTEDDTEIPKLNTLNYLVMTGDRKFPARKNLFDWNWIDKDNKNLHGAMAVRRAVFAENLRAALNKNGHLIDKIAFKPKVSIKITQRTFKKKKTDIVFDIEKISGKEFSIPSSGNTLLEIHYSETDKDSDQVTIFNMTGTVEGTYELKVNIGLKDKNKVVISADARYGIYAESHLHSGTSSENYARFIYQDVYLLESNKGKLKVSRAESKLSDKSKEATRNNTRDWITDVTDVANKHHDKMKTALESAFTDFTVGVGKLVSDAFSKWVFPGTTTFEFSDVKFSDHGDLVATITYKDPSEE